MSRKLKLAITGSMGSGKSVVARCVSLMGVPVYDCDSRAKVLMVSDSSVVKELKRMFGEECYLPDGSLDRNYLSSRIFADANLVKRVNALVHPAVKRDFERWANEQEAPVVAVETAILYESGIVDSVDKVLVVWSEYETAVSRCIKRSGMSRAQVISRLQQQMKSDDLLLLSDYSIFNDGNNSVLPQIISLLDELVVHSAESSSKILK